MPPGGMAAPMMAAAPAQNILAGLASLPTTPLQGKFFVGIVSAYFPDRQFGFIKSPAAEKIHKQDVWCHKEQLIGLAVGDTVIFEINLGKAGKPQAQNVGPTGGTKRKSGAEGGIQGDPKKSGPGGVGSGALVPQNPMLKQFGEQKTTEQKHVCCWWLQRRCRDLNCEEGLCGNRGNIEGVEGVNDLPCSFVGVGCKARECRKRNKSYTAPGRLGRYDPMAAAKRSGAGHVVNTQQAIKPLAIDNRPLVAPPGQSCMSDMPAYMQKQTHITWDEEMWWQGEVSRMPDERDPDIGYIDSEDARKEYGRDVRCPAEHLLAFDVGDKVDFEMVLDEKGRPTVRRARPHKEKVWVQPKGETPMQNREENSRQNLHTWLSRQYRTSDIHAAYSVVPSPETPGMMMATVSLPDGTQYTGEGRHKREAETAAALAALRAVNAAPSEEDKFKSAQSGMLRPTFHQQETAGTRSVRPDAATIIKQMAGKK